MPPKEIIKKTKKPSEWSKFIKDNYHLVKDLPAKQRLKKLSEIRKSKGIAPKTITPKKVTPKKKEIPLKVQEESLIEKLEKRGNESIAGKKRLTHPVAYYDPRYILDKYYKKGENVSRLRKSKKPRKPISLQDAKDIAKEEKRLAEKEKYQRLNLNPRLTSDPDFEPVEGFEENIERAKKVAKKNNQTAYHGQYEIPINEFDDNVSNQKRLSKIFYDSKKSDGGEFDHAFYELTFDDFVSRNTNLQDKILEQTGGDRNKKVEIADGFFISADDIDFLMSEKEKLEGYIPLNKVHDEKKKRHENSDQYKNPYANNEYNPQYNNPLELNNVQRTQRNLAQTDVFDVSDPYILGQRHPDYEVDQDVLEINKQLGGVEVNLLNAIKMQERMKANLLDKELQQHQRELQNRDELARLQADRLLGERIYKDQENAAKVYDFNILPRSSRADQEAFHDQVSANLYNEPQTPVPMSQPAPVSQIDTPSDVYNIPTDQAKIVEYYKDPSNVIQSDLYDVILELSKLSNDKKGNITEDELETIENSESILKKTYEALSKYIGTLPNAEGNGFFKNKEVKKLMKGAGLDPKIKEIADRIKANPPSPASRQNYQNYLKGVEKSNPKYIPFEPKSRKILPFL